MMDGQTVKTLWLAQVNMKPRQLNCLWAVSSWAYRTKIRSRIMAAKPNTTGFGFAGRNYGSDK